MNEYIAGLAACIVSASLGLASAQTGETVIWRFRGSKIAGSRPFGALIRDKGVLYGTTSGEDAPLNHGNGTVFAVTQTGTTWTQQVLYAFLGGEDGNLPLAGVVVTADGVLYGTTYGGGAASTGNVIQGGTVFQLVPPATGGTNWTETVIYRFPQSSLHQPMGALILGKHGVLYGTATAGGSSGYGGVFALTPPAKGQTAWTETTLYAFQGGTDGNDPTAALLTDATGALYGTTVQGGGGYNESFCNGGNSYTGCGTIFKLTPPSHNGTTWTETVLYAFTGGANGAVPQSNLMSDATGALYGTTVNGGNCGAANPSCGVVFKLAPPANGQFGWTASVLYDFQGYPADGQLPEAGVTWGPDGAIYGTTIGGSAQNDGTVFKLTPPADGQTSWSETVLYAFLGGNDGARPTASVLLDTAGNLFGTTSEGGSLGSGRSNNYGTVFEITP